MPNPTDTQQLRRDSGPITPRGEERKNQLLSAARRVFEDKGFVETRVADVVREAKVSHGTFYTYFDAKEAVFEAVARQVIESMVASMSEANADFPATGSMHERVTASVHRFVAAYRPNAVMLSLMEQVGTFSPELRALRLEARNAFVQRSIRSMQRMIDAGRIDAGLDAEYTAEALGAMLEYTCYVWFCLKKEYDERRLVDALSSIWMRALGTGATDIAS